MNLAAILYLCLGVLAIAVIVELVRFVRGGL